MMPEKYTFENWLDGVKKDREYALNLLTKEFRFTDLGIVEFCNNNPASVEFFSSIIGEPIDINNEAHIGKLISTVREKDETIAKVMEHIYNVTNFSENTTSSTSTLKEEKSEKVPPPKSVNSSKVSDGKIPFREYTIQYDIFVALTKFNGTKTDFIEHCEPLFETHGKMTVNRKMVINNTISMANKRGWSITYDKSSDMLTINK